MVLFVCGALFSAEGKLLLLRSVAGEWELPGGTLEFGEAPELGLVRCFREATDMDVAVDRPLGAWSSVERTGENELYRVHIGSTVTLSGALVNVEVDREVHAGFAWVTRDEARTRIAAPALRDAVERAFALLVASRRG
ncbi:MAG: NUDIX hydrolase [Planctomycetota bacterium]|nr:NUDIX hydrolase [Planctomycetota bacterium]